MIVLRDGSVVKEVESKKTSIPQVAEWMVGREISLENKGGKKISLEAPSVLKVSNLWVDMPGEIVRDVSLSVKEGEIFGIGGLAGQGKLGIPNGIMGLFPAGGRVEFLGNSIPLGNPRAVLETGMAFVSEDRRGVGLLLAEPLDWNIAFSAMQIQNKYLKSFLGGLFTQKIGRAHV